MYNTEHDEKPYYFGITLGLNAAQYKIAPAKYLADYDTIKNITPLWKPGFQLGIMGNMRLTSFIDARAIPSFMLRKRDSDLPCKTIPLYSVHSSPSCLVCRSS
ncbi:MAG: hypothetical protein IPK62_08050 [Bacteroidetes bacterium]|nr:hypothetical protein [Bacteroidota bacterium]